jgi:(4-alkanoyl-5-oxo-2,5-dihydrofuran-3-yl)methyl phosphate reductase
MIFVTGASGTVGREVVAQLLAQEIPVRALTRDAARAKIDSRAAVITGDTTQPETFAHRLKGSDALFSVVLGPEMAREEAALARVARDAGVKHIVKLSALGAGGDSGPRVGIAGWHEAAERELAASGVPYTFVQATAFMSNLFFQREPIVRTGKLFSNYGDGKLAFVHPRDIAAVAVAALTAPEQHRNKAYAVTGGEALSMHEVAKLLTDALGRKIEYVPVSDEATSDSLRKHGMPAETVAALLPFGKIVREGRASAVSPSVRDVTGRAPLTYAAWAQEYAPAFAAEPQRATAD